MMDEPSLLGYYLLSGACIYSAVHHLTYALHPPRPKNHLLFAGMCLVALSIIFSNIEAFQVESIPAFVLNFKITLASFILFYLLFVWFIAIQTGFKPRKFLVAITLSFCLIFIINLVMPYTIQYANIEKLEPSPTSWGSNFVQPVGSLNPFFALYLAHVLCVFGYFLYALIGKYRRDHQQSTLAVLLAIGLLSLTTIESLLVRTSVIDYVNLGPWGFLVVILVIGVTTSRQTLIRLQDSESQLKGQTRELRELYEQAKTINRLKDEFLTTVSHELRTPLVSILGHSDLLQSNNLDEQEKIQSIAAILRNATLQTEIVNELLDVSDIISGKLHLNVAPVDLRQAIQAAVDSVRVSADAKGISIHTEIDPSVGPVTGDIDRLQQVIWNILSNAVKFTPNKGSIFIQIKKVGFVAQVKIRDTGVGIEPEFLPYVFDRFRQEDSSLTREFGGLGLGLAIARHIIESHGGKIEAASEGKGKGTTFTFTLPLLIKYSSKQNQSLRALG